MKKALFFLLVTVILLSLCACGDDNQTAIPNGTMGTLGSTTNSTDSTEITNSTSPTFAPCSHNWTATTCTAPKTCTKCGAKDSSAIGHSWASATCTAPKTCTVCGATEGSTISHNWSAATCINPKTCSMCGAVEGSAAGHNYVDKTCTVCGTVRESLKENTEAVLNYLKQMQLTGVNVTAADVAAALGMEVRAVDGIFTGTLQRLGLGERIPVEIQLEDGTRKQVKYLKLTPAGLVY